MSHLGDPCIHCDSIASGVSSGPCPKSTGVAATFRNMGYWRKLLAETTAAFEAEKTRLIAAIEKESKLIYQVENGLDLDKVALAETVMSVSDWKRGGDDRESCRQDAIAWFATGKVVHMINGQAYSKEGLDRVAFNTKNYDRWRGQRSDHEYGFGPRHGSICFSIGLHREARKRPSGITDEEREACVYYLLNLEAVQKAAALAKEYASV